MAMTGPQRMMAALAPAVAPAAGAALAQDDEPVDVDEPVTGSEQDVEEPLARQQQPLEDDRIGDDIETREELREEIADAQDLADRRQRLEASAETAVDELREADSGAAAALDAAYGYAVFDATEGGSIETGTDGTGVAKVKDGGESTFMHVGGADLGLAAGGESDKLVLVFPDEETYDEFAEGGWEAGATARAAAGDEGVGSDAVTEDVQVYRLTDAGVVEKTDLTGMRFWPSEELNETAVAEGDGDSRDDGERDRQ